MCYVTFVNSLPYKAMRRLGKHTTYEFQTHVELDAPFCHVHSRPNSFFFADSAVENDWI